MEEQKKVVVYSTPSCPYCHMAKEFLQKNNISFEDVDVSTDIERQKEMIEKSGQMGVPVITVGEDLIIGFDKPRLMMLLGIQELSA